MNVDLRRFEYALEPLLRRARWRLAALESHMGRISREIGSAEELLLELRTRYGAQSELAARAIADRPDPAAHERALGWLCRLRREILATEQQVSALRARRAELAALHAAERHRAEVVERHREECVAEFVQDEERRLAGEADREWLARRGRGRAGSALDGLPRPEAAR